MHNPNTVILCWGFSLADQSLTQAIVDIDTIIDKN